MAGLLDFYGDPQANMALAAGLLSGGNFGQSFGRGLAGAQAVQIAEQEKRLREAQANEYAMRAERAKQEQIQQQAAAQRDEQFNRALQQGAKPSELAQFFPEKVDLLKKLADAPNFGRQAVARTAEVEGPNGAKMIRQLDQYGQPVSEDMAGYVAPQGVNLGNKYVFAKPVAGQSLEMGMSPSERDASARGWAGNSIAQQRLAMEQAQAGQPKPQFHEGQWITPPTAQNPQGTVTPAQGFVKLPGEAAKKQLSGIEALNGSINEYVSELGDWSKAKMLSPDARAAMGTKYNNMMLQAKEAYNLGVLNGPDYQILTSIVADPTSASSLLLSNDAMKKQATELSRIMGTVAKATRGAGANAEATSGGATGDFGERPKTPKNVPAPMKGMVRNGYKFKGGDPADPANWEKQ